MTTEGKLTLFHNDCDWVVAASPEDAVHVWAEWTGSPISDSSAESWEPWGESRPLTIAHDEDSDQKTTLTGAEWAAKGRAYIGSMEY